MQPRSGASPIEENPEGGQRHTEISQNIDDMREEEHVGSQTGGEWGGEDADMLLDGAKQVDKLAIVMGPDLTETNAKSNHEPSIDILEERVEKRIQAKTKSITTASTITAGTIRLDSVATGEVTVESGLKKNDEGCFLNIEKQSTHTCGTWHHGSPQ